MKFEPVGGDYLMCRAPPRLYYLAHPYASDPVGNVSKCLAIAADLAKRGIKVVPPILFTHQIHEYLKGIKANPEVANPDFWYDFDESLMLRCDGIIMSGDYRQSRGCMQEMWYFKGLGREILFYEDIVNAKGKEYPSIFPGP